MSPDLYFWFSLIVKMIVSAGFVLTATIAAERAGPLAGGLIATLPILAGPAYVFLALDHDASFIAATALSSLATNPAIAIYAVAYALLAQRFGLSVSLGAAFALWLITVCVFQMLKLGFTGAVALHVLVMPICLWIARPLREVSFPRLRGTWVDLALRASLVALLVAAVISLSFIIGPKVTGVLAVFPIVITSVILILHRRAGGKASAAVLANTVTGLIGFGCALATLHLTVVPLGAALALPLALVVSFGWGLLVIAAKRRGLRV